MQPIYDPVLTIASALSEPCSQRDLGVIACTNFCTWCGHCGKSQMAREKAPAIDGAKSDTRPWWPPGQPASQPVASRKHTARRRKRPRSIVVAGGGTIGARPVAGFVHAARPPAQT